MALINCPECGKEISDKAAACIHCGYPLVEVVDGTTNNTTNNIESLFAAFAINKTSYTRVSDIYPDVLSEATKIKSTHNAQSANDIIAKSIINGIVQIPKNIGWADAKLFCELIDFKSLSPDAIDYFANQLYNVISIKEYYDDGSGGYNYITAYFYPTYMVMQYASKTSKAMLMTVLATPYMGRNSAYDYVVSMYNQHAGANTINQIAQVKKFASDIGANNSIKCPVCGSMNVSRISTVGRLASVVTFGLASSKIGKQYECKKCKHKW